MNLKKADETSLAIKKNRDTLIEQTKTRQQDTFKFLLTESMGTFSLSFPLELL